MRPTKNIIKRVSLSLCAVTLIAACDTISNDGRHALSYQERHPIKVAKSEKNLEIPLSGPGFELSDRDTARIKSLAYRFGARGDGRITVSVPKTGVNAGAARTAAKQIAEVLQDAGVNAEDIDLSVYEPLNGRGGVRVGYNIYTAEAGDCDNMWDENLSDAYHNTPWKGLGCATQNNLAAMIANPRDLEEMPPMTEGLAARRVDILDKFIRGTTTGASRGAEETASATEQ